MAAVTIGTDMIDLLLVSNDDYCAHLATTLMSVTAVTHGPVRAHIVTDDASEDSRRKVARSVPTMELRWLECRPLDHLPASTGGIHPISYARLFGPAQVGDGVERLIYLDVDTLVRHDLTELWRTDLAGRPIAAVRDSWATWVGHPTLGIPDCRALGFAARSPYFNAGVMVIDVEQWNETDAERRCLEFLSNQKVNRFADQDALNAIFYENWTPLPLRWNVFADTTKPNLIEVETSTLDVTDAQNDPAIVHYAAASKPWAARPRSDLLFVDEWRRLAVSGPFSTRYQPPRRSLRRAVRRRLTKAFRALLGS